MVYTRTKQKAGRNKRPPTPEPSSTETPPSSPLPDSEEEYVSSAPSADASPVESPAESTPNQADEEATTPGDEEIATQEEEAAFDLNEVGDAGEEEIAGLDEDGADDVPEEESSNHTEDEAADDEPEPEPPVAPIKPSVKGKSKGAAASSKPPAPAAAKPTTVVKPTSVAKAAVPANTSKPTKASVPVSPRTRSSASKPVAPVKKPSAPKAPVAPVPKPVKKASSAAAAAGTSTGTTAAGKRPVKRSLQDHASPSEAPPKAKKSKSSVPASLSEEFLDPGSEILSKYIYAKSIRSEKNVDLKAFEKTPLFRELVSNGLSGSVTFAAPFSASLVREFYTNLKLGTANPKSAFYHQVYYRNAWYKFSPRLIADVIGCKWVESAREDELAIDESLDTVVQELTGGSVTVWPNVPNHDGVPTSSLTDKYFGLHRIMMHNWMPTSHESSIHRPHAIVLYLIGSGTVFNLAKHIFETIMTMAEKRKPGPLLFPCVIFQVIGPQLPQSQSQPLKLTDPGKVLKPTTRVRKIIAADLLKRTAFQRTLKNQIFYWQNLQAESKRQITFLSQLLSENEAKTAPEVVALEGDLDHD